MTTFAQFNHKPFLLHGYYAPPIAYTCTLHIHTNFVGKSDVSPVLPERYRQRLRRILHKDSKNITMKFFRLTNHTLKVLEREATSVVKLKKYTSRFPITKSESTPTLADIVQPADDVHDMFFILETKHFLTFYKFAILESIIEEECTDNQKLIDELEEYKAHFKKYIKRRVCESSLYYGAEFNPGDSCAPKEGCNLILITDESWNYESSLQTVLDLEEDVAEIFGIEDFALCLKRIEKNCLRLYHSIPTCLESVILSIKNEQVQQLVKRGIAEIYCGGYYTVLQMRKYK